MGDALFDLVKQRTLGVSLATLRLDGVVTFIFSLAYTVVIVNSSMCVSNEDLHDVNSLMFGEHAFPRNGLLLLRHHRLLQYVHCMLYTFR